MWGRCWGTNDHSRGKCPRHVGREEGGVRAAVTRAECTTRATCPHPHVEFSYILALTYLFLEIGWKGEVGWGRGVQTPCRDATWGGANTSDGSMRDVHYVPQYRSYHTRWRPANPRAPGIMQPDGPGGVGRWSTTPPHFTAISHRPSKIYSDRATYPNITIRAEYFRNRRAPHPPPPTLRKRRAPCDFLDHVSDYS